MKLLTRILPLLLASIMLIAQSPKPPSPLSNEQRLTLLSTYQRALLSQNLAAQAKQRAEMDATSFFLACAAVVKEAKGIEGTTCNVNVDTGEVTLVAPAPKVEGKK